MNHKALCLLMAVTCLSSLAQTETHITAIIPNGRKITPFGDWISVAPFPFALALRPDGRQLVVPSLGFPFALNVIGQPPTVDSKVTQIPQGFLSTPDVEVYAGVAYSPDGKLLYVATGNSGAVEVMDTWRRRARINLNGVYQGPVYKESFATSLVLSSNGRRLYVIDQANWRVVVIDTTTRTKIASLRTGVNPIALCLSPDGKRLYVATRDSSSTRQFPAQTTPTGCTVGCIFRPLAIPRRRRGMELPWKAGRFRGWAMPTILGGVRYGPTT